MPSIYDILGMTPQRRDFHYPRVLDRTERHSILLEDFRKEYDINMATETPLPDTSFTSQATEVRIILSTCQKHMSESAARY